MKRITGVMVGAAAAAVAATVGVTVVGGGSDAQPDRLQLAADLSSDTSTSTAPVVASSADDPAPSEPLSDGACPASLAKPMSLAPGVTAVVSRECGRNTATVQFALAGKANAASGSRAEQAAGDLSARPASYLRLIASYPSPGGPPGWNELPPPLVDDESVTITEAALPDGVTARVTNPVNNNGLVRVEWIRAETYYLLLSDRGVTSDGITGLPAPAVVAMAKQLR